MVITIVAVRSMFEDCKADANGLLFSIVDKHLRQVAEAETARR
jgi:hypothetical protein